jgi:hypothetical protein
VVFWIRPEFLEPSQTYLSVLAAANIASLMERNMGEDVDETPVIVPPGLFKNE